MSSAKFLDELSAKASELLAGSPAKDVEKNVRALLSQGFSRLDLVTREEFEIQARLLARCQEKLAQLEAELAALTARNAPPPESTTPPSETH